MEIRKLSKILFVLFFTNNIYLAQDSLSSVFPYEHYALQFQLEDLSKLSKIGDGIISGKYIYKNNDQVRAGVSFAFSNWNGERMQSQELYQDSSYEFMLYIQYLFGISSFDDILLFSGCGLNYFHMNYNSRDISTINVGIDFIVGIEWFLRKNISLSLENNIPLEYHKSINNYSDSKNILISINGISTKMGVSVFF